MGWADMVNNYSEKKLYGYAGKILYIDLTKRKVSIKPLNSELAKMFIGGKGFIAKLLYDLLPPKIDPFSPENALVFATGPLNGTIWPGTKNIVGAKSPLTGIYMDSYFSGRFGAELKYAGYDALVITGRSDKPVYLWIDDGSVEFRDATHIWGKSTYETYDIVKEEVGDVTAQVVCIGPAGENLVRFATIDADVHRQAARCGGGAVMGSKKLKAIAVRGSGDIEVAKLDEFLRLAEEFTDILKKTPDTRMYSELGTPSCVPFANSEALWPYRNWQDQVFNDAVNEYKGETQKERLWVKHRSGFACCMQCEKVAILRKGPRVGEVVHGIEYETLAMIGVNCGFADLDALAYANFLCDYYGLDTISTGTVAAFAMELYERGILTKEDTGGLKLEFGNYEALHKLIELIAFRKGIGNILAEGVKRAAERIGKGAEKYAIHVKGLELPAWAARGAPGMGLQYATVDRGGCHQRGWPIMYEVGGLALYDGTIVERLSIKGKAKAVKWEQDLTTAMGTLVLCDFTRFGTNPKYFSMALSLATGWNIDFNEFMKIGERVWNLIRMFNVREGISRKDDTLPRRFIEEPVPSGPAKGHKITPEEFNEMLSEYYKLRGWDEEGRPTKEKLAKLGLLL
jgi:aldehyde:ferredoxin oxidoreductase